MFEKTIDKKIKPDILLEFRQGYIGPNMRRFGNMFRVTDCPDDYLNNRVGVLDLRQIMGNSAVHSDMLMWHKDESPELIAVQIISILFGVMQYSARLDEIGEDAVKVSKFWFDFTKDIIPNHVISTDSKDFPEEFHKLLFGSIYNLYKINLERNANAIAYANCVFYDNKNKTLPVGMNLSTKMFVNMNRFFY